MNYKNEVKERWGNTDACKEHTEKTKEYSKEKWHNLTDGMNTILAEFAICMKNGQNSHSVEALNLVEKLQSYITENYYMCTDEILVGLGQMYILDERFKNNIDKHGVGTTEFISQAISAYHNDW